MQSVIFGVATASTDTYLGIMGLGYGNGFNLAYNNVVDELFEQRVTNSRVFSLALGSADASNGGVLIFGGVDTKKYVGSLHRTDILDPQGADGLVR
jgi:Eukaryotic aspartyl protease